MAPGDGRSPQGCHIRDLLVPPTNLEGLRMSMTLKGVSWVFAGSGDAPCHVVPTALPADADHHHLGVRVTGDPSPRNP